MERSMSNLYMKTSSLPAMGFLQRKQASWKWWCGASSSTTTENNLGDDIPGTGSAQVADGRRWWLLVEVYRCATENCGWVEAESVNPLAGRGHSHQCSDPTSGNLIFPNNCSESRALLLKQTAAACAYSRNMRT